MQGDVNIKFRLSCDIPIFSIVRNQVGSGLANLKLGLTMGTSGGVAYDYSQIKCEVILSYTKDIKKVNKS